MAYVGGAGWLTAILRTRLAKFQAPGRTPETWNTLAVSASLLQIGDH
jgi:hypothetical protein